MNLNIFQMKSSISIKINLLNLLKTKRAIRTVIKFVFSFTKIYLNLMESFSFFQKWNKQRNFVGKN